MTEVIYLWRHTIWRRGISLLCTFLVLVPLLVGWAQLSYRQPIAPEPSEDIRHPLEAPSPGGRTYQLKRLLVPFDAAKIALADALQFDPRKDAPFIRYLFIPPWNEEIYVRTTGFVLNLAVSQSSFIQYGSLIHPNVMRIDLRYFAPQADDLQNLINTWEQLAFDPYFHEFVILADQLDVTREAAIEALRIFVAKTQETLDKLSSELKTAGADFERQWMAFLKLAQLQEQLSHFRQFDLTFLRQFVKDADKALLDMRGTEYDDFYSALKLLRDQVAQLIVQADKIDDVQTKQSRRSGQGALAANVEVPVPARHAGKALEVLIEQVQSDAALTYAPYFIHRATSSVDLGHGAGLYYQFAGVQAGQNGNTDFQQALKDAGIDLEVVDQLRSKNSAAMFTSNVTGRERAVRFVQGQGVRPSIASGLAVWTEDPADEQVAAANSPVRNLLGFEFAAQEMIIERPNGMLLFTLFNAAGLLQNSAPDNVVADHSIPAPYTTRLQSCISCIRCHGPQRGRMTPRNDIKTLTAGRVDILDDLASADGLVDLLDQLVSEYEWDPTDPTSRAPLVRSRDDFDDAVFRATSGVKILKAPPYDIHRYEETWHADKACAQLSKVYGDYSYVWVTPLIALRELGYDVQDEKQAVELIRHVLPAIGPDGFGLTLLDPHIAWLRIRAGGFITRPAWELIYFDAALRSLLTSGKIAQLEIAKQVKRSKINRVKPRPATTLKAKEELSKRKAFQKEKVQPKGLAP